MNVGISIRGIFIIHTKLKYELPDWDYHITVPTYYENKKSLLVLI